MEQEDKLIELSRQGDSYAFGVLVDAYQERVINVVYRFCGDGTLAEDAAQEAFIRAWQNLARYRPQTSFRNWLYRIAINVALDTLRRERETTDIADLELPSAEAGPEHRAAQQEIDFQVRSAVLALPAASRAVLILREYEGLAYKEIAEALEIPVGTVMSRLNYARNHLRQQLAPWMKEE